jgi:hypothetical protein
MGISEVLTAPQSPWQNAFAERLHHHSILAKGQVHSNRALVAKRDRHTNWRDKNVIQI